MVVMGNPPYSVSSCNKNDYIDKLIDIYKQNLNERNIQPLSDDYIKFIRIGEHFIEKNNEGILAYVSNNSFLDGVIHREMRKHLLETFDKIYVINLHGNAKKKECCADGSKDENVFDIQQGVSINLFIKTGHKQKGELAKVYHKDIFGLRRNKYFYLENNELGQMDFEELNPVAPYYFFVPKNFGVQEEYNKGIKLNELFPLNASGVKTHHDNELVSFYAHKSEHNKTYSYRPFDTRYINYDLAKVVRHRYSVMKHFILGENIAISSCRNQNNKTLSLVSKNICDIRYFSCPGSIGSDYCFPLYLYEEQTKMFELNKYRKPNLNMEIIHKLGQKLNLEFTTEKDNEPNSFAPIDVLDYVYGILHSDKYRSKYEEFLKIDFPRIPYPENKEYFFKIADLGKQLREVHLMEAECINNYITSYPIQGDSEVTKIEYKDNKVYINKTQYFENVSDTIWNFYIGGYQPAQKWLKDRKGKILSYEDILYYQKILVALDKTRNLMQTIDDIIEC